MRKDRLNEHSLDEIQKLADDEGLWWKVVYQTGSLLRESQRLGVEGETEESGALREQADENKANLRFARYARKREKN